MTSKVRVDHPALYEAVNQTRLSREISWRQVGRETGVSPTLLARLRAGNGLAVDGFLSMTRWLGVPAERFVLSDDGPGKPDAIAELTLVLRRHGLPDYDVRYVLSVLRATLPRLAALRMERR